MLEKLFFLAAMIWCLYVVFFCAIAIITGG
jgi:hypothetical protein